MEIHGRHLPGLRCWQCVGILFFPQQMARDWKPGDGPSAEHRLGAPGDTGKSLTAYNRVAFQRRAEGATVRIAAR